MGCPAKRRAQSEQKVTSSSHDSSSASRGNTQHSTPKSIPRLDGNRDPGPIKLPGPAPVDYSKPTDLKNISEFLGLTGWYTARGYKVPESLPQRPEKFNSLGREINLKLNTFNVLQAPSTVVHQYDISWGVDTDATKRALVKKIWNSRAVKNALGEPANLWVYDGNKLAWCTKKLDRIETRIQVDLDAEQAEDAIRLGKTPRAPRADRKNVHTLRINWTRQVDFHKISAWLSGTASWSAECIDTINLVDHVMRELPSQKYTQIRKSFFQRGQVRADLGGGIEALKGVFSSLRPVLNDQYKAGLSINVDVANGTFWRAQDLTRAMGQIFSMTLAQFQQRYKEAKRDWKNSHLKKDLSRLRRVGVSAIHVNPPVQWTIDEISSKDVHEAKFPNPDDRNSEISVYDYFRAKYNVNLITNLPVVRMTKKINKGHVYLPMDVLKIDPNQRYNAKLSDTQTSQMIKFAVTLPKDRWLAVEHGVKLLDWDNDPYLRQYGIKINRNPSKVKARILPSPSVTFGVGSRNATIAANDLVAGRWRLDGRKFALPNQDRPIRAWGVCVMQSRGALTPEQTENFVQNFIKIYEGHGGIIASHPTRGKKPWMGPGNLADGGELVAKAFNSTGNYYQTRPMLMFFIVNDRNVDVYRRIKKSCDIRFGVASQVVQSRHAVAAQAQYLSNVCMKVNAKLGGATCVAKSTTIPKINSQHASIRTMVVGADVSHPAPGAGSSEAASFAAITVSSDTLFTRYWAECQTNGNRVEMVTTQNIHDHFGSMAQRWMQRLGQGQAPERVLYIRDGVSEGQYATVLSDEVRDLKDTFGKLGCKQLPKFTVVIAGKRHHIRFFPEKGDRNGNPLPGTLVESGCTHPFEFDFYLCAHVAIKGTARPIHYQCILNEGNWAAAELQQFIFEHSYQYVRSTTPVSLHPAVYYAHLAADRSRAHLNDNPVSSGKKEAKAEQQRSSTGSSSKNKVEIGPLHALNNTMGLKEVMWFV